MIYNDNNSTSKVFYSGFTITKVYACGELVWAASPYAFKAMYTLNDSTTGKVSCNSDSTLRYTDFGDQVSNVMYLTVGECVDNFETHLVSLMYSSLRTIDLTNSSITSLPSNFLNGVSTLREATLNPNTTTIGGGAFGGCTSLSDITIPSSVTSIELGAFRNSGLRDVTIYSGITYGNQVYSMCSSLSSVTIEEGTRSIPNGTFALSSGITEVTIPSSVTYVGSQAFIGCYGLSEVTCLPTTPPNLGEEDVFPSSCIIYVPCSAMSAYTAHTDWQPYLDKLRPIEDNCETIIYRWQPSGTTCIDVDKYQNNIKQISYNSGATWSNVSPSEYSASTLIERNSTDCGYIEPQYRTISTAVTCSGVDKYKVDEHQESLDGGVTWTTTSTTIGDLIQANSYDCGYRTRTTSGTPYCVDVDKYQDVYSEYSTDSGTTWITASTTPTLIEADSEDCGYVPPIEPQYRTITSTTCVGVDKWQQDEYQESLDGGVTWTTTGSSATTLIEANSYDCGFRTRQTSGTPYCDGYDKYQDVYDQVSTDAGSTWTTTATTPTLLEHNSEDCGYVPPIEPQYRTLTTATTCSGVDKYVLEEHQESLDSGVTWTTTSTTIGSLIESNSFDCGYRTRTATTATTCVGYDKYTLEEYQVSTDSGTTWTTTGSSATTLIEADSEDCGYVPPTPTFNGKWKFTLNDTSVASAACGTAYITQSEVSSYQNTAVALEIGSCCTELRANAFMRFSNLETCNIGSGVTRIGANSFNQCTSLTEITIPDNVTTIDYTSFYGCSSLSSVTIGSGVTYIGSSAFVRCTNLTGITINATTPPQLDTSVFGETNNCPLFVPCQSLSAYQTAWSTYASRIQAIP